MKEITRISPDELARQQIYIDQIAEENAEYFARTGRRRLAYTHTYGCQQNVSDGERIDGMLAQMGYGRAESVEEADFILYNTCAVREGAEDRVYGNAGALKHLKNRNKELILAIAGCMVQQKSVADKLYKSFPYIDLVMGTHVLHRFPELLFRVMKEKQRVYELPESEGVVAEGLPVLRSDSIHAWLPIMNGCDNFCSYCIVPHVRGRERSRRPGDILREASDIVAAGYKEITLLGQNVNSYGKNLEGAPGFPDLLRSICGLEGDFRVRFMTSHPKDATPELFKAMAESPKAARHLHLPVQAGSDQILKAMNRKYTAEAYLEKIHQVRELMPDIALTSDIIVGFPGETEEDFEKTLELVKTVGFDSLFMFIYSKRKGTPAERMDDPIPAEEKSRWFSRLVALQDEIMEAKHRAAVGRTVRVLVDGTDPKTGRLTGKDSGVLRVRIEEAPESLMGQFAQVKLTSASRHWVDGVLV